MSDPAGTVAQMPDLTDLDRQILDLERRWWQRAGAKDAEIRHDLDLTPTAYYARLNQLLEHPQALAVEPTVVNRLRRLRDQRIAKRRGRAAA